MADKLAVIAEIVPGGSGFHVVDAKNVAYKGDDLSKYLASNEEEVGDKADKEYVDTELAKKANASDFNAYKTSNNAEVAKKANTSDVNTELGKKLNTSDFNTYKSVNDAAVAGKVNKSYVDTELAKKANTSDLAGKANASDVAALQTAVNNKADGTTVSALAGRVSTNETNIAAANARIDGIVAIPPGSTEGNTELIDIRTGSDGKNYATAGDAVRQQITDLKSDLTKLSKGEYLLTSTDFKVGAYENGDFKPNSTRRITANVGFVSKGTEIKINPKGQYYWISVWKDVPKSGDVALYTNNNWTNSSLELLKVGGYLTITVANGNTYGSSTDITPSDLEMEININYVTSQVYEIAQNVEALNYGLESAGVLLAFPEWTEGYFVRYDNVKSTSTGFKMSSPIYAEKGKHIKVKAKGYNAMVKIIALTNADGTSFSGGITSTATDGYKWYDFTMPEDGYFVVSGHSEKEYEIIVNILDRDKNSEDIESIEYAISMASVDDVEFIDGGFIKDDDTIEPHKDTKYSAPIYAKKGTKICVKARGYRTNVKIISLTNETGTDIHDGVKSVDNVYRWYEYIMKSDGYYRVSGFKDSDIIIKNIAFGSKDTIHNFLSIFNRVAVIGDSLSCGTINTTTAQETEKECINYSWLSVLGKKNGFNVVHYAKSGMTCKAWLENSGGFYSKFATDDKCDIVYINLGTNDGFRKYYPAGTVDDSVDSNTYAGYYKSIIEYVHSIMPNAIIFCMSKYTSENGDYMSLVKGISEKYDYCFYIDLIKYNEIPLDTCDWTYRNASHYTTLGYSIIADNIAECTNDVINSNMDAFKWFAWNNS